MTNKNGYLMHKELKEQPLIWKKTLQQRVKKNDISLPISPALRARLAGVSRIKLLGCGSSYHAALIGRAYLESFAGIAADVELADEFAIRGGRLAENDAVVFLSQSGETADVLLAARSAKRSGALLIALTNDPASRLAKLADWHLPLLAGKEKAVVATKTFTAQLLALLALTLGWPGASRSAAADKTVAALMNLPEAGDILLFGEPEAMNIAYALIDAPAFFVLGTGHGYGLALELALKFKEAAYLKAEAISLPEFEHGPKAACEPGTPVIIIDCGEEPKRVKKAIATIKAARGTVVVISPVTNWGKSVPTLGLPKLSSDLLPIVGAVTLQLLAFHAARARGLDPDRPRSLTKFVK
jgi:glutamine---fructose-6-phosphate transaminase (isomerizing)